MVQGLIEVTIQLLGSAALQLATLGRYARIWPADPLLLEGRVGFALVVAAVILVSRGLS